MKRSLFLLVLLVLLMPSVVSAHITNEHNLYDDLQYSSAQEEIVYLSGLGVIAADHSQMLFQPKEKLTRADLALWAGSFNRLGEGQAAVEQAVQTGLLASLDGTATYEDVNRAFFQGSIKQIEAQGELTREEFAQFVVKHLGEQVDGQTMYERAGLAAGPTGVVQSVAVHEEQNAAGKTAKVYTLKVAGSDYVLAAHPKVLHVAVDPAEWKGKTIQESWLGKADNGQLQLQLLTFAGTAQSATSAGQQTGQAQGSHSHAGHDGATTEAGAETGFSLMPIVLIVLVIVVVVTLLFRTKRK